MKFDDYDREKKVFLVTFPRDEVEDLLRLMQGISSHIEEMDKAALGIYSRDEAETYIGYIETLKASFGHEETTKQFEIPERKLLELMDVVTTLPDIEGEESCMTLGVPLAKVRLFGKLLREGYNGRSKLTTQFGDDKKKLLRLEY